MIKVIIGTSFVPPTTTTTFIIIILFLELGILLTLFPQFVYAQTAENEIIENALESVEKATTEGISEIKESMSNASKATDSTNNTSDRSILQNQSVFEDSNTNWINGESDKLSFKHPSNWDVNVSDSRFDNYELIFIDKTSKSSIRVSDEAIETTNKIFLTANNPQGYFDIYMMQNSPLPSTAQKIETYPKGKVTIAGLQAYSELYLDNEYANLISLAFQKANDRQYIVLSRSPSSQYDNLEPTMLEIIQSITPKTIQKPSDREVEILSNNTDSGDFVNHNQTTGLLKKEDLIQSESLLSNKTKSNTSSNESLIIQQQQKSKQQPQNGFLIQQSSNIYEGLGIKIKYFEPWKEDLFQSDEPSCLNFCIATLTIPNSGAHILINQDKFDNQKIMDKCKCDTLLEYVKYEYQNTISKYEDLVFINDNQTTLTDENIPAIQMEYENKGSTISDEENTIEKSYTIYTKGPTSFYRISFSGDKNEQYPNHLDNFKTIINSLEFVSTINETNNNKPKQPSFMTSEEDINKSISPSISNNENEEDVSSEIIKAFEKSFGNLGKSNSSELTVLSHNSYVNSAGNMHIIGEVKNNTPDITEYVKIIGTFYDNNNKVVGTSFTFTEPSDLGPYEKAPFDLILQDTTIPIEQIERYSLKISSR